MEKRNLIVRYYLPGNFYIISEKDLNRWFIDLSFSLAFISVMSKIHLQAVESLVQATELHD